MYTCQYNKNIIIDIVIIMEWARLQKVTHKAGKK